VRARDLPTWRQAWTAALYGPDGFYRRERPSDHFRTSVHASPLFAEALLGLARSRGLGAVTDVGAGDGGLLRRLLELAPGELDLLGVDLAPRPDGLPDAVRWRYDFPGELDGLVVANEWLDNIPCDVVEVDDQGVPRYVHVDPDSGQEALGEPCREQWVARWWPVSEPGARAEVGSSRDRAWADVVRRLRRGVAVAVDYGHTRATRPALGSLAAFRHGQAVDVVPDGTRDITAHVAVDSLGGERTTQRDALHALGVDATRPPAEHARTDPAGYVAALSRATQAAELTDPDGLGGFYWVTTPGALPAAAP
jgi:SAM-dependent MidA family methyltransferase